MCKYICIYTRARAHTHTHTHTHIRAYDCRYIRFENIMYMCVHMRRSFLDIKYNKINQIQYVVVILNTVYNIFRLMKMQHKIESIKE